MNEHKIVRFDVDCNPTCGGFMCSFGALKKQVSGDSPNTANWPDFRAIARTIS
jgi:hypothetical protein